MAIPRRLRFEVLRRDGHRCRYCGAEAPEVRITVDHVIPVALGGKTEPANLVAACADCNGGKSAVAPDQATVDDVSDDQLRWDRAMATAIERRAVRLAADREWQAWFDGVWTSWTMRATDEPVPRDGGWRGTILRFRAAGLDDQFLIEAVETSMRNTKLNPENVWRYFCGICWRTIDQLHEEARAVLIEDDHSGPAQATDLDDLSDVAIMATDFVGHAVTATFARVGATRDELDLLHKALHEGTAEAVVEYVRSASEEEAFGAFKRVVGPVLIPLARRYMPIKHPDPTTTEN